MLNLIRKYAQLPYPRPIVFDQSFTILDAKVGVDGIYSVQDSEGQTFQAYCDMNTDGGAWALIARWVTSPAKTITWGEVIVEGNNLNTTTNSTSFPVIPTGRKNVAKEVLFKHAAGGWTSRYGNWLKFQTTKDANMVIDANGIQAVRGLDGKSVAMHGEAAGWNGVTLMQHNFSLWTQWGNGGPCGGANVCGTQKICPVIRANYSYSCHFDFSSLKQLFVRGVQATSPKQVFSLFKNAALSPEIQNNGATVSSEVRIGPGQYLSIPDDGKFALREVNFEIEAEFIIHSHVGGTGPAAGTSVTPLFFWGTWWHTNKLNNWEVVYNNLTGNLQIMIGNFNTRISAAFSAQLSLGVPYKIKLSRSAGTIRAFVDDVLIGEMSFPHDIVQNVSAPMLIGRRLGGSVADAVWSADITLRNLSLAKGGTQ